MNILIYIIFTLYFTAVFQITNIGTFGLPPAYPFVMLVYVLTLFNIITNKYEINTKPIKSVYMVLLLQFFAGVSVIYVILNSDTEIVEFIKSYFHFLFLTFFALIFGFVETEKKLWANVIKLWLILSILINIFGIYQLFARAFDLPFGWIELTNASLTGTETETYQQLSLKFSNFYRATSIFSEPSALAGFNLNILGFCIYPIFNKDNFKVFKSKALLMFIVVLSVLTLFVTFSLTGVLGLIVLLFAYVIFNQKINYLKIFKITAIIVIVLAVSDIIIYNYFDTSVFELFYNRILSITGLTEQTMVGESFGTRGDNFLYSLNVWLKSPIIGVGLGQTNYISMIGFSDYGMMHCLIETGILGGFCFLFMFVFLLVDMYLIKQQNDRLSSQSKFILNASFYNITLLLITNLVTSNLFIGIALWVFIAMAFGVVTKLKKELGYNSQPIFFFKKKPLGNTQELL